MKQLLRYILLFCIITLGLTGCQSSEEDESSGIVYNEEYYLDRIAAYKDYYKDYEDKYEIEACIALDKNHLPVMWISLSENDGYTSMIRLISYDNARKQIVSLGEISLHTLDSRLSIIPNEDYLVLKCNNNLVIYDETKKSLYCNEDVSYLYEKFNMSFEEFLENGDDAAGVIGSGIVYHFDDENKTITYIGEVNRNTSYIKLDDIDALSSTSIDGLPGYMLAVSDEYLDNEAVINEFIKLTKTSKLPEKAQEFQDNILNEADEILDMSIDEISAKFDVSKKVASQIYDQANVVTKTKCAYYDKNIYTITYANGVTKEISYSMIRDNKWSLESYYGWFMDGLGFEVLLDRLYKKPAYTVTDLQTTYYNMDEYFDYTIIEFKEDMIPKDNGDIYSSTYE